MDLVMLLNYGIAFFKLFVVNVFILIFLEHRDHYKERPKDTGKRPMVSIIIPAYNEGLYIANCLKTVLALDYPADKLDIIVVDDGSKDGTYKIAKGFESANANAPPSLRVFTKKNGGKGAALNYGIARAKGEFIATMDADSYLSPGVVKSDVPFLYVLMPMRTS